MYNKSDINSNSGKGYATLIAIYHPYKLKKKLCNSLICNIVILVTILVKKKEVCTVYVIDICTLLFCMCMMQLQLDKGSLPSQWDSPTLLVQKDTKLWLSVSNQTWQSSTTAGWMRTKTHCTFKHTDNSTATVWFQALWISSLVTLPQLSRTVWSSSGSLWTTNKTQWLHMAELTSVRPQLWLSTTPGLSQSENSSLSGSRSQHTWVGHGRSMLGLWSWRLLWQISLTPLVICLGLETLPLQPVVTLSMVIVAQVLTSGGGWNGEMWELSEGVRLFNSLLILSFKAITGWRLPELPTCPLWKTESWR